MVGLHMPAIHDVHGGAVGAHTHLRHIRGTPLAGTDRQALGVVHDTRAPARCRGDRDVLALSARHLDRARRPRGPPGLQVGLELFKGRGLSPAHDLIQVARHLEGIDESAGGIEELRLVPVDDDGDTVAGDEDIASVAGWVQTNLLPERRHRACAHVDQLQGSPVRHGCQDRHVVAAANNWGVPHLPDAVALLLQRRDRLPLLLPLGRLPRPAGAGFGTRARHEDVSGHRQGSVIHPGGFLNLARRLVHRGVTNDEPVADGRHAQIQTVGIADHVRVAGIPDDLRLRARNIHGGDVKPLADGIGCGHVQGRAVDQRRHLIVLPADRRDTVEGPRRSDARRPVAGDVPGARGRTGVSLGACRHLARLGTPRHEEIAEDHEDDDQERKD